VAKEGTCLLVVCVGHIRRRGAGLVWALNEVPEAVENELGPPAVHCETRASPGLLKIYGFESLGVNDHNFLSLGLW